MIAAAGMAYRTHPVIIRLAPAILRQPLRDSDHQEAPRHSTSAFGPGSKDKPTPSGNKSENAKRMSGDALVDHPLMGCPWITAPQRWGAPNTVAIALGIKNGGIDWNRSNAQHLELEQY
jgi:hypothetical protein